MCSLCTVCVFRWFRDLRPATPQLAITWLGAFVSCYFASGALASYPAFLYAAFLAAWAALLARGYSGGDGAAVTALVRFCVAMAVLGPLVEGAYSMWTGFFAYGVPHTHVFGVPVWLSPLYLLGGGALASTAAALAERG